MPANHKQKTAQPSFAKPSAKYTNKDGSKFITIPQVANVHEPSLSPPAMAHTTNANGQLPNPAADSNGAAPKVNHKKQKRRQKAAAKAAAEPPNGSQSKEEVQKNMRELEASFRKQRLSDRYEEEIGHEPGESDEQFYSEDEVDAYSGSYGHGSPANGYDAPEPSTKRSKKKKKGRNRNSQSIDQTHRGNQNHVSIPPPPPIHSGNQVRSGISREKIWNTSSQEERERIKEFWLSLGEDERKSLVKVEKDAVLKKMKEQQKHSCSCTVCGRKRTAIEEELEVLYDAYYEELEQYANNQGDGSVPMLPPPRKFGAISGLAPPHRLPPAFSGPHASRGRIIEHVGDDEEDDDGEDEYSDEDAEDEEYSDEEPEEIPRSHATDFFNFGNSLTVQGGILTVADDLLKNDGKKFIEMMEQLAERRMQREEDAERQFSNPGYGHPANGGLPHHSHAGHSHPPPPPDDEEYDDEEEEEDDEFNSEDDDYDEEEMDTMTEEQRMEEGRRMFQIFAARMFEQRVLTAYKEKVARERQQKLLEELEEEGQAEAQRKAKKAKEAQRKKDRNAQKKQALAEEKARKEAEKAAEEAAQREIEEKKAEEQRIRNEEKRKKREAQRKADEEERLRKEADKQRRLQEQRERQAEIERKQREAKEREKKEREEAKLRAQEAKEAKEKEARERKEKQERERKEREAKAKAEKEAKEQQKREEQAAPAAGPQAPHVNVPLQKRPIQPISIATPFNLQGSPHVQVATPVGPKAPTPLRSHKPSELHSNGTHPQTPQPITGKSQNPSPNPSTPHQESPGLIGPPGRGSSGTPFLHQPQASSPMHSALKGLPLGALHNGAFGGGHYPPAINGFQPVLPPINAGYGNRMHHDPMLSHQPFMGNQYRSMGPGGLPGFPGSNSMSWQGRGGFPLQHGPPGFSQQIAGGSLAGQPFPTKGPSQSHSRHQSASMEKGAFDLAGSQSTQPISRPAPIGRPSSIVQGHRSNENTQPGNNDMDDIDSHLGSSALLADSDEAVTASMGRRASAAPGLITRQPFGHATPFSMDPGSSFGSPINSAYGSWGAASNPFGASSLPGAPTWSSNSPGSMGGWPTNIAGFGSISGPGGRLGQPRSVAVRLMLCRACKLLEGTSADDFHSIDDIREQVDRLSPPRDEPVSEKELLEICETEGTPTNGGGSFEVRVENDITSIKYELNTPSNGRSAIVPGEIGSPIVGGGMPAISRFTSPPSIH